MKCIQIYSVRCLVLYFHVHYMSRHVLRHLLHDYFSGCSFLGLWNLPAADVTFLPDVRLLNGTADQYPSCDAGNGGSVGSAVLRDNTLNTATVAYYTGSTTNSYACFVCDERYKLNTTLRVRVCQRNGSWSGNPIICGKLQGLWCTYKTGSML